VNSVAVGGRSARHRLVEETPTDPPDGHYHPLGDNSFLLEQLDERMEAFVPVDLLAVAASGWSDVDVETAAETSSKWCTAMSRR
jgi:hypothetical protein